MKTEVLDVDGQSIATHSVGSGPAIFLCHGNSSSSRVYKHQLEGSLGRSFRIVALDLPGHGESPPVTHPSEKYTVPAYARVLVEVARQLSISDAVFAGWSMGGHILIEASVQLPEAAGFVIFGTPPLSVPVPMERAFLPQPLLEVLFREDSTDEEIRACQALWFKPGTLVPDLFFDAFRRTDKRARSALMASVVRGDYRDEVAIVAAMKQPLAVLHGSHDLLVSRTYLAGLSMPTLWKGAIQDLDVGHTPQWETPALFDATLDAFARDCFG